MFHSGYTPWKSIADDHDQTLETLGETMLQQLNTLHHHWLSPMVPETEQQQPHFSSSSLDLLRSHVKNSFTSSNRITSPEQPPSTSSTDQEPTLMEIIRIAATAFINSSTKAAYEEGLQLLTHNENVMNKVRLVQLLLNAAELVGRHKYDQAIFLLDLCRSSSSKTGMLIERVVYYFSEALSERVGKKSRFNNIHSTGSDKLNAQEAIAAPSPIVGVIYAKIPFYQVRQLAGVQAVVDSVDRANRIHIIDLRIRNGMQWTALMQALSSRKKGPPEILKITAIVNSNSENSTHETGERLGKFANSMNIPFSFRAISVPNMIEIHTNHFNLDPKDVVVVFSENALHGLIQMPNQLEAFMRVIRNIRPKVMVVTEREAEFNSSNFAHRFVEVLFHYGAYFDCIDTCLGSEEEGSKMDMESMFLSVQVKDVLVKEDAEMTRTATIDVWRRFFRRYWMLEARVSAATIETVNLLLGKFEGGRCCTLDKDGRSLVVGWKGTPIFSLSAWKFLVKKPLKQTDKTKLVVDAHTGTQEFSEI
ncbi:DELLA protein GAI1 [Linum perenne]